MTCSLKPTLLLTTLALFAAIAPSQAEQTSSICIYASKNYSEGAFLCVQKSIALVCRADGERFAWTTVTDRDLADKCATPEAYSRRPLRVRTAFRARHHDLTIGGAKCFEFNGKQYCE
jgi:hypothetical protein